MSELFPNDSKSERRRRNLGRVVLGLGMFIFVSSGVGIVKGLAESEPSITYTCDQEESCTYDQSAIEQKYLQAEQKVLFGIAGTIVGASVMFGGRKISEIPEQYVDIDAQVSSFAREISQIKVVGEHIYLGTQPVDSSAPKE